jgi:predicted RNase H-like nuclease
LKLIGGMNGAAAGWLLVTAPVDEPGSSIVLVVSDLTDVLRRLDAGELAAVAIDIPIGLPDVGPRACDVEARAMIGPRQSSVFPAPVRSVLGSTSYEDACQRSIAARGKSVSRQAFAILPKIEAVDGAIDSERQRVLIEVHPEVSFTAMAGRPMAHHKATPEGQNERLALLRREFADLDEHADRRLPRTRPDDVLDAFVAAWSARRWVLGTYRRLGGDLDERGLRMEVIA